MSSRTRHSASERVLPSEFSKHMLDSLVKLRGGTGAADVRRQREAATGSAGAHSENDRRGRSAARSAAVPRHHGVSGDRTRRWRMWRIRCPCSTFAIPRIRSASVPLPTRTSRSGTRRASTTTERRCSSPTSGAAERSRAAASTDKPEWGADAIFTLSSDQLSFKRLLQAAGAPDAQENCVAHNGSLIPVPGRDIMTQGWYQGGVSVFDFTDPAHPKEIAYFDRGPIDSTKMYVGGSWSAYWYNGYIYSSEIARGLDVFDLQPSALLSQNEIDAAKLVHFDELNVQDQQTAPVASELRRLASVRRSAAAVVGSLGARRIAAVRTALAAAEQASGAARRDALTQLATPLDSDASELERRGEGADASVVGARAGEMRA